MNRKPYKIVAKAIIFDRNQSVLVLRKSVEERRKKNSHGWDFPGGGLEPDEPVMEALEREVLEETGLEVKVVCPAYVYDEIQEEKHLIVLKFVCHQPEGQLTLSDEHESAFWFRMTDLDNSELPEWMKDEIMRAWHLYKHPPGV